MYNTNQIFFQPKNDINYKNDVKNDKTTLDKHDVEIDKNVKKLSIFFVVLGGLCCTTIAKSLAFGTRWVRSQYHL